MSWEKRENLQVLTFVWKGEPLCLKILKSGWCIPQMYHVIIEHGDMDEHQTYLYSAKKIKELYDINVESYL